jgi:hypothetical protein
MIAEPSCMTLSIGNQCKEYMVNVPISMITHMLINFGIAAVFIRVDEVSIDVVYAAFNLHLCRLLNILHTVETWSLLFCYEGIFVLPTINRILGIFNIPSRDTLVINNTRPCDTLAEGLLLTTTEK